MTLLEIFVILGVDNNPSSYIDSPKNNFLKLGEGMTEVINCSAGTAEKN